jgi:hypothetical protein
MKEKEASQHGDNDEGSVEGKPMPSNGRHKDLSMWVRSSKGEDITKPYVVLSGEANTSQPT